MEIIGLIAAVFIALQTVTYIPKVSVSAEIKHHEVVKEVETSNHIIESTE
jgi:hypothetical protein